MDIEQLITEWHGTEGGAERANYALFLTQFCQALGLPSPAPATSGTESPTYQFEAFVRHSEAGEPAGTGRIDLYKPGHFVLEAKQSRIKPAAEGLFDAAGINLAAAPAAPAGPRYDALMRDARRQAEGYARALPASHGWPPFLIVADIGRSFELYFDWSGMGKDYGFFLDRQSYRIDLTDLRKPEVQALFRAIWTDPHSIDPRRRAAEVTRDVSLRLAEVSKWLEASQKVRTHGQGSAQRSLAVEETALFLMRLLFCMFAEDVGLLPKGKFQEFLSSCLPDDVMGTLNSDKLRRGLEDLWHRMNSAAADRWSWALDDSVRYFNGGLFENNRVFELDWHSVRELVAASRMDWKRVEPAIFGALLEQALTPVERAKLGAHYTPRPYVERLVEATVMEPLRDQWAAVQSEVAALSAAGDSASAGSAVAAFHTQLIELRVLDPACGTGNFLYVAMELLLRLESEVLDLLGQLGQPMHPGVEPKQFLGLELNPRAAVIAELVLWIGWLRWRIANDPEAVPEPVLQRTAAINFGGHGGYDALLAVDPATGTANLASPTPAAWPEVDFIVGNPPFIGKGAAMRGALGDDYVEALWKAYPDVPGSADLVMFWWDKAAALTMAPDSRLQRFGFVTTNSITGSFNRRVIERFATDNPPLSIVFAVPDHPWTKASRDAAAVRIAMTAAAAGARDGQLSLVVSEAGLDTETPEIIIESRRGHINADLTVGADATSAAPLKANEGIAATGMLLAGQGFKVTAADAALLIQADGAAATAVVRPYVGGGEILGRRQNRFVIDFFGLTEAAARQNFPACYTHVLKTVKPERDLNRQPSRRDEWWLFGRRNTALRAAMHGQSRFIATTETAKHRVFQFVPAETVPDHMVITIALEGAFHFGVLSSDIHVEWALAQVGTLEDRPRYNKSLCFDPFPSPTPRQRKVRRFQRWQRNLMRAACARSMKTRF